MLPSVAKTPTYPHSLSKTPVNPSPGPEVETLSTRRRRLKHTRKAKNLALKSRRIELADIPDQVINKILDCFTSSPSHIRLVNKRLAILALPYSLRTVSVSSPGALSSLILSPESPLYNLRLGKHVQCLQMGYVPRTFELLEVDKKMTQSFPNLVIIRFKLSMGALINPGSAIQSSVSQDVLHTSIRLCSGAFLRRFLSQLRPRRFEWVSPEPDSLYLVGVYPMLRSLFYSWETLNYIYLEGVCLIEQPNLASWHISLLARRVHIKAPFSKAGPVFLEGLQKMRNSNLCSLLVLEESTPENLLRQATSYQGDVPVLAYGNTMVTLKYWSTVNRRELKSRVLGRSLRSTGAHKLSHLGITKPALPISVRLVLPVLFLLALAGMTYLTSFDISKGTSSFSFSGFLWIICYDGSALADAICASETSLWFPDRSLMLHPT